MSAQRATGPVEREGNWEFAFGALVMTIDPSRGGRITQFSYDGRNCLLPPASVAGTPNANNFGVTFWPSPQAAWGWPPVEAIDSGSYEVTCGELGELLLESGPGALLGGGFIRVKKTFLAVPERSLVEVGYQIVNCGPSSVSVAPWQIARVAKDGLTLFGIGAGGIERDDLAVHPSDGLGIYEYAAAQVTREGQKTFADAKGWVAHIGHGLLFVQTFPDLAPGEAAPGEAELELYADPSHTYIEIEPQGRLTTLEPGQRSPTWTVGFRLLPLPAGVRADANDPALLALLRQILPS